MVPSRRGILAYAATDEPTPTASNAQPAPASNQLSSAAAAVRPRPPAPDDVDVSSSSSPPMSSASRANLSPAFASPSYTATRPLAKAAATRVPNGAAATATASDGIPSCMPVYARVSRSE